MGENFLEGLTQLLNSQVSGTSLLAYPIAFIAGVLISFTPCVYPLIPIIIGYIAGKQVKNRGKIFTLSLFYVIGMAVTYAGLGVFAALSGRFFGEIQTSPITYLVVANIIIFLGLSQLGVFSLSLPSFLSANRLKNIKGGFTGAFAMGLVSGFLVTPCTAAVLGTLLSYVATRQNLFFGATLLFVFAQGVGFLLILVGTSTGMLISFPKAGPWMVRIQKVFGVAMLLLGEYFLLQAGRLLG